MATAHFVLVGFSSPREPAIADWRHTAEVVRALTGSTDSAGAVPAGAGALVGWRLVAANSRILARSPRFFANDADARSSIAAVVAGSARASSRLIAAPSLRGFGWYVSGAGDGEAMCARWYEGRAIAQNAARLVHRILVDNRAQWEEELPVLARMDVSSVPRPSVQHGPRSVR